MPPSKPNFTVPEAYVALGANVGPCRQNLAEALRRLDETPGVHVRAVSSVYRTAPVGLTNQPEFLNAVARLETDLEPRALLQQCLSVEASLGRERLERWGPRVIDLDVLWHSSGPVSLPDLELPHPRMDVRGFVMIPLAEVAPDLPLAGGSASTIAARLGSQGVTRDGILPWRTQP